MAAGRVLVYGGKGALGSAVVSLFKSKSYWVGSIDLAPNEDADVNIVVKPADASTDQEHDVTSRVGDALGEEKVDAILCVAGGWAGGNAASKELVKSADNMWKQSVLSSVIATALATRFLKNGGLLTLPGAQPALEPTPGMIGYGIAKAAVHHLVKSLGAANSGMPPDSAAIGILPITLDTPMNRKWMSQADFSTWTALDYVADLFAKWTVGQERPSSGSLVQLITKDSKTELVVTN